MIPRSKKIELFLDKSGPFCANTELDRAKNNITEIIYCNYYFDKLKIIIYKMIFYVLILVYKNWEAKRN